MHSFVLSRRKTRPLLELSEKTVAEIRIAFRLFRARESIDKETDTAFANKRSGGTEIFQGTDAPIQEKFGKKADSLLDFMKKRDTL